MVVSLPRWTLALAMLPALACGGSSEGPTDNNNTPSDELTIVTTALTAGALGQGYDQKIEVTGGTPPYAFTVTVGEVPPGTELTLRSGQVKGTPTEPGTHEFTVQVTDEATGQVTRDFSIYVEPDALAIETTELPEALTGEAYAAMVEATGGVPPLTWAVSDGALPDGVTLASDGSLSGTPTETGVFDVTLEVTDSEDNAQTRAFMLAVRSGSPLITTEQLLPALVGERYEVRLEAEGGRAPYTWSLAMGELPEGMTLQDDGLLFGTPTTAGETTLAVQVEDDGGRTDSKALPFAVIEPLAVATRNLPVAVFGQFYEFQLEAQGGLAPYRWILNDPLPAGLTMTDTGLLRGTPTETGDWMLTIRVQDALQGVPRSARFTLRVRDVRIYQTEPSTAFPPNCSTSTIVSYQHADIQVADSFAVSTINVDVDVDFTDAQSSNNRRLKLILWGPDGRRSVLCGNGAGVRGSSGCNGSNGIQVEYGTSVSPQVPLRVFQGMNAQGTWRFSAAVVNPSVDGQGACEQAGTINRITMTMEPDNSPDPYIVVRGFTYNNLLIDPWVRISGGGLAEQEISLVATLWHPGANGRREGGLGDDQPDPVEFTWTGNGLPTGASISSDGRVRAGPDTSAPSSFVTATDTTGTHSVTLPLHVVAPDWNPWVRNY